ncbi:MAG: ArsA family ATPase [Acidimicrobiia bacterium]
MEFNQKLLFLTGKGGTGKSFLSCIIAANLANQGKKVCIVDVESTGAIASYFEHEAVGYEPVELANNIFLYQIKTDEALAEYLYLNAKIPTWAKLTPLARLIDLISNAAPGVREILLVGKICHSVKLMNEDQSDFDVIIVDAPSSGHIVSLLDAPNALSEIVTKGMIQEQTKWMQEILEDPKTTGVFVVTNSDEIVVSETKQIISNISEETSVEVSGVIVNQDIADLSSSENQASLLKNDNEYIDEIRSYYAKKMDDETEIVHQFKKYNILAFPQIDELTPSVRSIKKNAELLKAVNHEND